MKHPIRDMSQIIIAVLVTTSMVMANAQKPDKALPKPAAVHQVKANKPAIVATVPKPTQTIPEPAPAPKTVITPAPASAPVVAPPVAPQPKVPATHVELMAAAGIAASDYGAVDYIVSHESGWNPNATEPHTGAHGLPQALPYSKTGCGWVDAICQLQWANSYALARYGGWWPAQAYWAVHSNW